MWTDIVSIIVIIFLQYFLTNLIIKMLQNSKKIEEYHMSGDMVLKLFLLKKNKQYLFYSVITVIIIILLIIRTINSFLFSI